MNKVITINLGGTAWQLEEDGYETLRAYLETATTRLQGNPDRDEIISDIEWAIAEKFRGLVNGHKNVVLNQEVATVLTAMGPIEAEPGKAATPGPIGPDTGGSSPGTGAAGGSGFAGTPKSDPTAGVGSPPKRLYRIPEGAMIAGVCNGVAAYFNIDPTLVRLAFAFSAMAWGVGIGAYIIMALVVPKATTPEEKAAATGSPTTAEDFIRRAKAGYYEAIKGFPNREARRDWQRRFRTEMRAHTREWHYNWRSYWGRYARVQWPEIFARRYNWRSYWGRYAPTHPGMSFALPFISLLAGVVTVAWVCVTVSLLSTGAVVGIPLPASVPVWVAAVGLFILYGVIAAPLKLARRLGHWGMNQPRPAWSAVVLCDAVIGMAICGALGWLAYHHFPEVNAAVKSVPVQIHQAANDIHEWWHSK